MRQLLCHMILCYDRAAQRTPVAPATAEEAWWLSEGTGYPAQCDQSLAPGECVQAWVLLLSGIWQGGGPESEGRECCLWVYILGELSVAKISFVGG